MILPGGGVFGECSDSEFQHTKGWFQITDLSWTAASPDKDSIDDAVKQRDMALQKLTIKKLIDRASPDLFRACLEKTEFERATIVVRESGTTRITKTPDGRETEEKQLPYLKLHFENVEIGSVIWGLTPGQSHDDSGEETIEFLCGKMCIEYLRQETTGKHEPHKMGGWDFIGHKRWGPLGRGR
jgi:type VI protein secretion system component Hcp